MQALRRHSTATAHISSRLAQRLGQPGERLYLCGLLHDIGIAACLLVAPDLTAPEGRPFTFEQLRVPIHAVHERAAGVLGSLWELPEGLRWALVHHHDFVLKTHVSPMPALVCLASWIASEAGASSIVLGDEGKAASIAAAHFGWESELSELVELGVSVIEELSGES
jgi:HD-like signal output (HDOD) protein